MSDLFSFLEGDDGSDSGGDIGSTIFDPGSVNLSNLDLSSLDLSQLNQGNMLSTVDLINDPELFKAFATLYPEDAALLENIKLPTEGGKEYVSQDPSGLTEPPESTGAEGAGFPGEGIKSGVKEWDDAAKKAGVELTAPPDNKSLLDKGKDLIKNLTGLDDKTINELGKYGLLAGIAKLAYDDAEKARQRARGWIAPGGAAKRSIVGPKGHVGYTKAAQGGVMSLAGGGDVRQPFYLGGSTDGMTDEVPAHIDGKRPAALSDGEFVIPADVVSHLGNGNSNAGAQRLYEMMDQVRQARTGTTKQGKQINPEDFTKGVASFAGGGTVADQYGRKLTRANYEGKVDRQGIPDDDDDPFNYNPNARKYTNYNNELFLIPARNELDEPVRANLFAQDPTGERELIEKAYSAMPRDQLGNVFDQLDARDAWNVNQAAMGTAHESPWLLNPENRMMAVGIKDDIIGKPSVLLYNPNQGAGVFVNPYPRGLFGSVFQSGDPETDFQQALNLTPFEQYAMLNNIGPYSSDRIGSLDASMTDEERWAVYEGLKNLSGPLPKLTYQELERGYFNPIELNPFAPYTKKRANPEIREPYEFYQKYLNLNPVDNLLPLYLSLNPLKP